jgi:hypothetical protein
MRAASFRRSVYASRGVWTSNQAGTGNADAYRIQGAFKDKASGVPRKNLINPSSFRERASAGAGCGNLQNGRCDRTLPLFSVAAPRFSTTIASPSVERGRAQDPYLATEIALDAVVKVFAVSSSPNYFLPWQNKAQREATGSGKCLLSGHMFFIHTMF